VRRTLVRYAHGGGHYGPQKTGVGYRIIQNCVKKYEHDRNKKSYVTVNRTRIVFAPYRAITQRLENGQFFRF